MSTLKIEHISHLDNGTPDLSIDSSGHLNIVNGNLQMGGVTMLDASTGSLNATGIVTAVGGNTNNTDDAAVFKGTGTEHIKLLLDTSSTGGHRASVALESNSNEVNIATTGSDEMRFSTANTSDALFIKSDGNVGIGTSSPGRLLTLFNDDQPVFQITNNTSGSASTNGMIFYQASGSTNHNIDNQGSGSGGDIQFMAAGSNTLKIQANGNVGIGTTTPSFATIDTYSQRGIEISGSKETGTAPVIKLTETGSGKGAFEIRSNREGLTSGNYLAFGENTDTFMVIRGDDDGGGTARRGNVGIGTTNPFNKLQIGDGAVGGLENAIGILTHYGNQNTALGKIRWHDGANATGQIHTQYDGSSVDMHFGHLYNGGYDTTSDLIIKGNGAVTTPNNPAFDAYYTTNGTWSVGANTTLVFNATTFNQGGHYNTSNGRFTAPVSGVYHFTFYSIMIGNYNNGDLNLYVNGGRGNGTDRHFTITNSGGYWNTISGSNTRYLNAGDYVLVFSRSGADFHGGYWSNFSGHLVG